MSTIALGKRNGLANDGSGAAHPYEANMSSNLSTSLNPTPKHPLAYHLRNHIAKKNHQRH